ncbi:hypothetical protein [Enterococcus hirae]|uniref:hypothetical protein n=1 Tax=Enterococcus hirae TaxID=1354 RepID=UPI002557B931|nr:hypothetical protein [Enterococcus hirae]
MYKSRNVVHLEEFLLAVFVLVNLNYNSSSYRMKQEQSVKDSAKNSNLVKTNELPSFQTNDYHAPFST